MLNRKLIASVLILLMFFMAGLNKAKDMKGVAKGLGMKIPKMLKAFPLTWVVLLVIAVELVCPVLVVYANLGDMDETKEQINNWCVYILIAFTVLATLLYHPPTDKNQLMRFFINLAVIGGLVMLLE